MRVLVQGKSGVWVKIKYNDSFGWVNGSFLRDFRIKSFQIGNHDGTGKWITLPGDTLYASKINHLGIFFELEAINNYDADTKTYIKIITPENKYIQGKNVRSGYAIEYARKLKSGSYWIGVDNIPSAYYARHPGTWLIQMYYQNPINDNTFDCIASKLVTLN